MNERPVEAPIDLVPQPVDVHVHHVCQAVKIIIPDMLLNHRSAHNLTGMPHQVMQERELLGRKLDSQARTLDRVRRLIDHEISDFQARRLQLGPRRKTTRNRATNSAKENGLTI